MAPRRTFTALLASAVILGAACTSTTTIATTPSSATAAATRPTQTPTVSTPKTAPSAPPPACFGTGIVVHLPRPSGVVAAFGDLWAQSGPSSLWKITPSGHVLAKLEGVSRNPPGRIRGANQGYETLAAGFGSIWTLVPGEVLRLDPVTDRVIARINVPVSGGNQTLAIGLGAIWLANNEADLIRIDPAKNTTSVYNVGTTPVGITFASARIWIPQVSEAGGLVTFDPRTRKLHQEPRTQDNGAFVMGAYNKVWVAQGDQINWIDPANGRQRLVIRESQSVFIKGVTSGLGRVFFNGGRMIVLDPANRHVRVLPGVSAPRGNAGIAVLGHRVWMVDTVKHRIVGIDVCARIRCA